MGSSSRNNVSLHERLEKVEKQNRRMKSYMIFLIITLLALAAWAPRRDCRTGIFARSLQRE